MENHRRGKPFQAGNQYGKGRPAGSRNKASIALDALLEGEGDAILRKAIELAVAGNETALSLCLSRLIPPRRDRLVRLRLSKDTTTSAGIATATAEILSAVAKGEITPGEAVQIASVLDTRRKTLEMQEHEDRLSALERRVEVLKEAR